SEILDYIKNLGFKFSTKSAITISVSDMIIPPKKKEIIKKARIKVEKYQKAYRRGLISDEERYNSVIETWTQTTEDVTDALMENLDYLNNVFIMANSGARGSKNQIRQLAGMRGLMANAVGKTVEIPIISNFREGLSVLEYFISTTGARKGLADTALRTADSGYLTRRLVDVSQDVIVREVDCGTTEGIIVKEFREDKSLIEKFSERLIGRYPAEDVYNQETGELICSREQMITEDIAENIEIAGYTELKVRSVLTCQLKHGVCAKCYGRDLATGKFVNVGEAVGIIAAQSIGEPGTQLTMRTFHTGGVAGADITQGLPRVEELFEARKPKGLAVIAEIAGRVSFKETPKKKEVVITGKDDQEFSAQIVYGSILKVEEGDFVEAGDVITGGSISPHDIIRIIGIEGVENYIVKEVQKVYRLQGVEINDKHIEIIIRQMLSKIKIEESGDTTLLPGTIVSYQEFLRMNEKIEADGGEPAKGARALLGITKASLATDSFLSAASFQETTRVLTDAAIRGKEDKLLGLKENVIIGKLIPAGTGIKKYKNIAIDVAEDIVIDEDII
ncbi:MAG: DNA-directed RNA polymerase subunit beta', partial [Clostridiales bacterium]|nr:DNA-directed RNA polymerase subunit beta' [Clostridiales bacterium]